jgi:hypothetical protein
LIDYFGYAKHQDGLERNDSGKKRPSRQSNPTTNEKESTYVSSLSKERQEENKQEMLGKRKEDLIFMSPLLKGFALKNKLWCEFMPPVGDRHALIITQSVFMSMIFLLSFGTMRHMATWCIHKSRKIWF